jgi:hypothetical protein
VCQGRKNTRGIERGRSRCNQALPLEWIRYQRFPRTNRHFDPRLAEASASVRGGADRLHQARKPTRREQRTQLQRGGNVGRLTSRWRRVSVRNHPVPGRPAGGPIVGPNKRTCSRACVARLGSRRLHPARGRPVEELSSVGDPRPGDRSSSAGPQSFPRPRLGVTRPNKGRSLSDSVEQIRCARRAPGSSVDSVNPVKFSSAHPRLGRLEQE